MKKKGFITIVYCVMFALACSCNNSGGDGAVSYEDNYDIPDDTPSGIPDWALWRRVSIHDEHSIDTSRYQKFQRFDFCKLKGIGRVEKEPYVLVRDSAEFKIIRRSDDLYNVYRFQNMGDHWYNFKNYDPLCNRDNITMSGSGPADVHRFVQNGRYYEYMAEYDHETVCIQIRVFSDMNSFIKLKYDTDIVPLADAEFSYSNEHFIKLKKHISKWSNMPKNKLPDFFWRQNYIVDYNESCIKERTIFRDELIIDSIPYSPLGELDDVCTMPRTMANRYGWKQQYVSE